MRGTKQKAAELVGSFKKFVAAEKDIIDNRTYKEIIDENAKQCALIAVDEIIKSLKVTLGHLDFLAINQVHEYLKDIAYFQEVKQEIQNLHRL